MQIEPFYCQQRVIHPLSDTLFIEESLNKWLFARPDVLNSLKIVKLTFKEKDDHLVVSLHLEGEHIFDIGNEMMNALPFDITLPF